MGKYKELLKNIGALVLGNFGSRLLAFFLVPLYTAILSTEDFGNYDIIYTTIILLFPILTLDITEGAMRFLLDKNVSKTNICKKCISIINTSIILIVLGVVLNNIFHFIPTFEQYGIYFALFYATYSYYTALQNIARGLDKIKIVAVAGLINSALTFVLNIIFLVVIRLGLDGYFLAGIIANGLTALFLIITCKLGGYILSFGYFSKPKEKELLGYSRPLMLNSISWWVNDASDRYIVTWICGAAVNGVYSVAYKIPTILSIFHNIFNQAWLISVTKEYKQNKNAEFVQETYSLYNIALIIGCSILIVLNKVIARILYQGDFYEAWQYVPFLLVSVVFAAIGSAIGIIFSAEKDSKIAARTTAASAVMNIILNIILINQMSAIGAAIATAVSSFVVWLVRLIYCRRYIKIKVSIIDILSYLIIIIQAVLYMAIKDNSLAGIEIVLLILVFILNTNKLYKIVKSRIKKGLR